MELNLKAYLANVRMTMREFSEMTEISMNYLSNINSGKIVPSKKIAKQIERATNGMVKIPHKKKKVKLVIEYNE